MFMLKCVLQKCVEINEPKIEQSSRKQITYMWPPEHHASVVEKMSLTGRVRMKF